MENQKPHKIQFRSYLIIAGFIAVAGWGWYVLEQFTNLRITTLLGTANEEPIPILLPLAISVLGPLIAVFLWKRALGIVQNGISTFATVRSIGPEIQSMRNVEFTYIYDGSEYSKK